MNNVLLGSLYERMADDGPKVKECSRKTPLICQYFTSPVGASLKEEEKLMYTKAGAKFMVHNSWVMDHDPLVNFARPGSNMHLRRELVACGDSVKLRFGDKPGE